MTESVGLPSGLTPKQHAKAATANVAKKAGDSSALLPKGLGDAKPNVQITTADGAININDAASPYKAVPNKPGVYTNQQTGESLRISSQGTWGDTWLVGKLSDNDGRLGEIANWLNNDWAQVGRRSYIEHVNAEGKVTQANYYRANDHGKLIETETIKPENGEMALTEDQLTAFREKTEQGIGHSQLMNTNNAFWVPMGAIGALAALILGGMYAGGAMAGSAIWSQITALGGVIASQLARIGPLLNSMRSLLTQSPKVFGHLSNAIQTLATKLKLPNFKMPTRAALVSFFAWEGISTVVWEAGENILAKPISRAWNHIFGKKAVT
jgi:hypothetical protein